jgi:hypothetical protein
VGCKTDIIYVRLRLRLRLRNFKSEPKPKPKPALCRSEIQGLNGIIDKSPFVEIG